MCQLDRIRQMRTQIQAVARKHKVRKLFVFGSCARKEETAGSDIDFVAEFRDNASLFDHAGLEISLQDLLGVSVDVVSSKRLAADDVFSREVKREMLEIC